MGLAQAVTCEVIDLDRARRKRKGFGEKEALFLWMYANAPKEMVMLAFPDRRWKNLEVHAARRHVKRPGRHETTSWAEEEISALTERWGSTSQEDLLQKLAGRSWKAISAKALKLGLCRAAPAPDALPLTYIPGERWAPIKGLEKYSVSDRGRVASGLRLMRQLLNRGGRPTVWLSCAGRATSRAVAALVLEAFGPPKPSNAYVVGYRDGDERNLAIENLKWVVRCGQSGARDGGARKTPIPFLPLGERLRVSLARDPIWSAADAALSRNMRPDIRDDVIENMILAHLEGTLPIAAFSAKASEFVRSHNRFYSTAGRVSLDQNVPGTDGLRIGDLVSDEDYRDRWGALEARC